MNSKKINGAGVVAISRDLKRVFVLKNKNKIDLPKGAIEKNENSFDAAFREAYEEAGIAKEQCEMVVDSPYRFDNLVFYYVFWDGIPEIKMNPSTGIVEHDGFEWMTWKKAVGLSPDYLRPAFFHGIALRAILPRGKF